MAALGAPIFDYRGRFARPSRSAGPSRACWATARGEHRGDTRGGARHLTRAGLRPGRRRAPGRGVSRALRVGGAPAGPGRHRGQRPRRRARALRRGVGPRSLALLDLRSRDGARARPARWAGELRDEIALCGQGPQIELIEPVRGPSIYHEWLEEHGAGLHHIGVYVEDLAPAWPRWRATATSPSSGAGATARRGDGGFAYFDLRQLFGIYTELIEIPRGAGRARAGVPAALSGPALLLRRRPRPVVHVPAGTGSSRNPSSGGKAALHLHSCAPPPRTAWRPRSPRAGARRAAGHPAAPAPRGSRPPPRAARRSTARWRRRARSAPSCRCARETARCRGGPSRRPAGWRCPRCRRARPRPAVARGHVRGQHRGERAAFVAQHELPGVGIVGVDLRPADRPAGTAVAETAVTAVTGPSSAASDFRL